MFSGSGTNNFSIAPNILRQMANDPEKRMEYEALIYDCANVLKDSAKRPGLKAQGIILDSKGELSMWSISQTGDDKPKRSIFKLNDDEKKNSKTKASTDKVDAEIKQLKNKKAQLEQKISSEPNSADLQRQLAQIENELRQKDNDAYRRRLAKFSAGIDITI